MQKATPIFMPERRTMAAVNTFTNSSLSCHAKRSRMESNMKVRLYFEKGNLGRLAVVMAFTILLWLWTKFPVWILPCFGGIYFFIKSLKIELNKKLSWLWSSIMLIFCSFFSVSQVQFLLLNEELRAKLSDTKMFQNVLCCLTIYLIVQIFTGNTGLTCIISHLTFMLLAGINYFVYLFRGNEFIFSDLRSISTGLSVAGNYEFVLDERAGYVVLLSVLYVAFFRKLQVSFVRRILMRAICFSLAVLCCIYIGQKTDSYVTETWEQKGSYRNGYILNFLLSIRDTFVAEPEDYSDETVSALEMRYRESGKPQSNTSTEKPTILVVMSESYADLHKVGNFYTNREVTPFYDSLQENTLKGYALSSVFGAKTPNSEWEFLTGNSMAYLPDGSVVYQQYISDAPASLVTTLKDEGYTCVAMHPYYETGWSRNMVYPDMGFDEMYFMDDFDNSALLREYITDQELYRRIIERFENKKENENLFIMSVSMQNHGGYTEKYSNFNEDVRLLGVEYPDVNQYLSLLRESDIALEELISYFSQVDEPVEIVFFGDHQPSLSSSFYPYLNGKGLSGLTMAELENLYTIPFFIWTNYESESTRTELTSLNYLSTLALEKAGLELPSYHRFLSDMMEVIPAINARGYYSKADEKFKHIDEATGEEAKWLSDYEILQYNSMFDKAGRSSLFFPAWTE